MSPNAINNLTKITLTIGILFLASLFILNIDNKDFYINYLSVFTYFISLSLGGTFFIVLLNLTRAGWGTMIKRVPEYCMSLLPYFTILFIPLLFGLDHIYEWLDPNNIATDYLIKKKLPYLNKPFFIIRNIFYFIVFTVVSIYYWKNSIKQDKTDKKADANNITKNLQRKAPIAILLLSLATSFASFDWLMSLFSHWFSTIYGIYYFAGAMVFLLATTILTYDLLRIFKYTSEYPNIEHFHDLSKLLYGFIIFWSYVAFSQYFLTWYANIPEFTQWYYPRTEGDWNTVFYLLMIFHFIVPLFGFMSRHVKRHPLGRSFFCILIIIIHYIDIRFQIYPNITKDITISNNEYYILFTFAIIIISLLIQKIVTNNIIPKNDPRIEESKKLENAI